MRHFATYLFPLLALLLSLTGCSHKGPVVPPAHRGVYHWKTTYNPTAWELQWMKNHHVDRLYIKLFDVKPGKEEGFPEWAMVPAASTEFRQALPADMEVVPVVYITVDAIRALNHDYGNYAALIVKRIDEMMADHYEGSVREIQLDCDWTRQTEQAYFLLVSEINRLLHPRHITVSGTLRLHQLHELDNSHLTDSLPFDRTLLMCYNTGALQNPTTHNSILDPDDVKPYLRQYRPDVLPRCDVAFPVYGWGVEFDKEGRFNRLINSQNLPDAQQKQKARGVTIREEWGDMRAIVRTQELLPALDSNRTTILYHLDSLNLSKYSYEDIETIYSR